MINVLIRREATEDAAGKRLCEDRARDGIYAATAKAWREPPEAERNQEGLVLP